MPSGFPASLDSFTDPTADQTLGTTGVKAFEVVALLHDAVEKLEAKVGIDSSAVTTSHDYKLANLVVLKALFDANTLLAADSDNTPTARTIAEGAIVGRPTGGSIKSLTAGELLTILQGALDTVYAPFPITARKTANETVNNSSTLQDDDALTVAVAASSVYVVDGLFVYSAAGAADIKFKLTPPGGGDGWWSGTPAPTQSAGALLVPDVYATALTYSDTLDIGGAGLTDEVGLQIKGLLVTSNAGNLVLSWAQLAAAANNATVYANSYLSVRKVA